jgi:hypothetical protein
MFAVKKVVSTELPAPSYLRMEYNMYVDLQDGSEVLVGNHTYRVLNSETHSGLPTARLGYDFEYSYTTVVHLGLVKE